MTASNWTECPKCKKNKKPRQSELLYGKVSREEYIKLVAAERAEDAKAKPTLREDWEFDWTADGKLVITYGALCTKCDFKFEVNQTLDAGL